MAITARRPEIPKLNPNNPLTSGLLGFWEFNRRCCGYSSTEFYPIGRTFRPFVVFDSGPVWATGSLGDALWFDGTGAWRLELDIRGGLDSEIIRDFTMLSIVERPASVTDFSGGTTTAGPLGLSYIIGTGNSDALDIDRSNAIGLRIRSRGSSGVNALPVGQPEESNPDMPYVAIVTATHDWYHRLAIWSPEPLGGSTTVFRRMAYADEPAGLEWRPSSPTRFLVGTHANAYNNYSGPFHGMIYAVAIWRRSLSPMEMQALVQDPWAPVREDTVLFWIQGGTGITGSVNVTQDDNALSASGSVEVSGQLSVTEDPDVLSASGSVSISGSVQVTEDPDILSTTGSVEISGSLSVVEDADGLSASGSVLVSGSVSVVEDPDVLSSSGSVVISGQLSVTEESDTLSSSGSVLVLGTLNVIEEPDTLVATGSVGGTISGSLNVTQDPNTLSASSSVLVSGQGALSESDDVLSSSGSVAISGSVAVTEESDLLSSSARAIVSGSLSVTQDPNAFSSSGSVLVRGSLDVTEADDVVASSGSVRVGGTVQVGEDPDVLQATGSVLIRGYANLVEDDDILDARQFAVLLIALARAGLRSIAVSGSGIRSVAVNSSRVRMKATEEVEL